MDSPRPRTFSGAALRLGVYAFLAFTSLVLFSNLLTPTGFLIAATLSTFGAAAVANALSLRIYERGQLADIGMQWNGDSARNLGLGFAGGAGAACLVLAPPLLAGLAEMRPAPEAGANAGTFLFVTLALLFGVLGEEMLFRGYGFQVLLPVLGSFATILPTSVLFGLAHSSNLNVSNLALGNTMAWGVLLGYAVVRR